MSVLKNELCEGSLSTWQANRSYLLKQNPSKDADLRSLYNVAQVTRIIIEAPYLAGLKRHINSNLHG